ncbi:MAG: DUF1428 domain-containing protein [Planctomycetota bacterium]
MASYIDGFAFPIATERLDEYKVVAEQVALIYKEHGALDYVEFLGDDLERNGTASFPQVLAAAENETVVFGWIVYESQESRERINRDIETDPRIHDLVAPLVTSPKPVFDPARMAYGGFKPLVRLPTK